MIVRRVEYPKNFILTKYDPIYWIHSLLNFRSDSISKSLLFTNSNIWEISFFPFHPRIPIADSSTKLCSFCFSTSTIYPRLVRNKKKNGVDGAQEIFLQAMWYSATLPKIKVGMINSR